jgi:hypothetical protein
MMEITCTSAVSKPCPHRTLHCLLRCLLVRADSRGPPHHALNQTHMKFSADRLGNPSCGTFQVCSKQRSAQTVRPHVQQQQQQCVIESTMSTLIEQSHSSNSFECASGVEVAVLQCLVHQRAKSLYPRCAVRRECTWLVITEYKKVDETQRGHIRTVSGDHLAAVIGQYTAAKASSAAHAARTAGTNDNQALRTRNPCAGVLALTAAPWHPSRG